MFYLVTNVSKEVIFLASDFVEQLESSDEFVFALLLKNLNIIPSYYSEVGIL